MRHKQILLKYRKALLLLVLLCTPILSFCQRSKLYGSWEVINTQLLVTSDIEDKAEFKKKCTGILIRITENKIEGAHIDNCQLDTIKWYSIKKESKWTNLQIKNQFSSLLAGSLFSKTKKNEIEMITTDYIPKDGDGNTLKLFLIDNNNIAIYSDPILIYLKRVNKY